MLASLDPSPTSRTSQMWLVIPPPSSIPGKRKVSSCRKLTWWVRIILSWERHPVLGMSCDVFLRHITKVTPETTFLNWRRSQSPEKPMYLVRMSHWHPASWQLQFFLFQFQFLLIFKILILEMYAFIVLQCLAICLCLLLYARLIFSYQSCRGRGELSFRCHHPHNLLSGDISLSKLRKRS